MTGVRTRLWRALTTVPRAAAWRRAALEACWSIPLMLAVGLAGGIMRPGWPADPELLLRLAALAVFMPALGEELLFRAALLPTPEVASPRWRHVVPVLLFVLWHPPQALIFGPHWAQTVCDPVFLICVAILGTALTRLYLATGSIWPCVALHWIAVVGWKALLGGPSPWIG